MTLTTLTITTRTGEDVVVAAEPTECPYLVITQGFGTHDGTELYLTGGLNLRHTITGALLPTGGISNLRALAIKLVDVDWNFADADHFMKPENTLKVAQLSNIIHAHVISENDDHWIDNSTLIDLAAPATSLLANSLDDWQKAYSYDNRPKWDTAGSAAEKAAYLGWITSQVNAYGVIYLLAVLRATTPAVADQAARQLASAWEAGDSLGEWVWQWNRELTTGRPLTLHGIPHTFTAPRDPGSLL